MIETQIPSSEPRTEEPIRQCGWEDCKKGATEEPQEFYLDLDPEPFFICHLCTFHVELLHRLDRENARGRVYYMIMNKQIKGTFLK